MAAEQAIRAAELVARAQQGDGTAFADLYEEYGSLVFNYLRRRMAGPNEAVEDLTEDVFVKVYEKLHLYADRGLPFSAWLYRLAHNVLVDYLRKLPRQANQSLDAASEVVEPGASVDYGQVLDRQTLELALAQLTPEQRQAVAFRFLKGLSTAETAAAMGRSEDAVKKLQARGLAGLRRILTAAKSSGAARRDAGAAA